MAEKEIKGVVLIAPVIGSSMFTTLKQVLEVSLNENAAISMSDIDKVRAIGADTCTGLVSPNPTEPIDPPEYPVHLVGSVPLTWSTHNDVVDSSVACSTKDD